MPQTRAEPEFETLLAGLTRALDGGPPVVLGSVSQCHIDAHPEVALVLSTSGSSSGRGRPVGLTAAALRASAAATAERLAGPGQWLLTLPAHHVAGVQVLCRSVLAGTVPVRTPPGPFRPEVLARTIAQMRTDVPRYVSLVPTQLVRVLRSEEAVAALRSCAAVLVGGAATSTAVLTQARAAGVQVVTTYGMTETCGGCVYDGVPLPGVQVRLGAAGRVLLAGPMLAVGYLDGGEQPFVEADGQRWLATGDAGQLTDGVLTVVGRIDEVIVTGGVNVHPVAVESALSEAREVAEVCVVGVPDAEWGQLVTAVVVPAPGSAVSLAALRDRTGGGPHAPRALVTVPSLPVRGPGKTDRRRVAALAAAQLAAGRGQRH
ncbi:o-succinylbenzoate--CoA ligase [Ruania albidiflava]|uniref:o-succinylbenzoate--CoA ligase n=1 Tax=Ruania albidiflava TaxID=366586 RepID=UPI0003B36609|nr:o-succinylbenzoate--CoA ligase [Ruania albidiflava]